MDQVIQRLSQLCGSHQHGFIDLFAGTGAFSMAFEDTNSEKFKCIFSNDIEKSSEMIYNLNHPYCKLTRKDLNLLDASTEIPDHSILCAGFVCQPFSIAGKMKGFDDPRADAIWKLLEIVEVNKPQVILFENVKNLISHNKGRTYEKFRERLESFGYHIKQAVLDTCKVTEIPQHRERLYIVGFRNWKHYKAFEFDFPQIPNKSIRFFLEPKVERKYYYTERFKSYPVIKQDVVKHVDTDTVYQWRRTYVRENRSNCCPTLTANMGTGGHNVPLILDDFGIRKLTPRECFNLQGFPKEFALPKLSDSSLYKLAGNAVSLPVVKLIVEKLDKIL